MKPFVIIKVWKKGRDSTNSSPDYRIEVEEGELSKITDFLNAIYGITGALKEIKK